MIRYTQGNLLDDPAEALVNTVNTVGVMGKGIALMFKEAFPANYHAYAAACKTGQVRVGQVFATRNEALMGPRWIINFPTKQHWRGRSQMVWIRDGLDDLVRFIREQDIRSIALPPLGSGNGGLHWPDVRTEIEQHLGVLGDEVEIVVYEPTSKYQNVAKRAGVKKLTPARALIAELVREYAVLGFECSLLEIQKLAWLLERSITRHGLHNVLDLRFHADKYGPYAPRLTHLLNALDGSYLHCDKRIPDAGPLDVISFDANEKQHVATYLHGPDAREYLPALAEVCRTIDGFQSPLGLELLATVDWLVEREGATASTSGLRAALDRWPAGTAASKRKQRLFTDQMLSVALQQLSDITMATPA